MNYKRIYDEFISDRKTKQPAIFVNKNKNARNYVTQTHDVEYREHHHIVPRSLGGTDKSNNIVSLSPEDHLFAHLLLAKIYGGPMWGAFQFMCEDKKYRGKISRAWYRSARKRVSGDNNVMRRTDAPKKVGAALSRHWANGTGPASPIARARRALAHNSPEYLEQHSKRVTGRSNPMFGRIKSSNPNAVKVRCIETGKIFNSAKEAAEWCGVEVNRACSYGIRAGGYHWERVGKISPLAKKAPHRDAAAGYAKRRRPVRCIETGQIFNMAESAGKWAGVKNSAIHNAASGRVKTSGGYRWEYFCAS
jgi:hypothetical protein